MFAVVQTGGKQYKVAENDVISVERLSGEAGDQLVLEQVLMLGGAAKDGSDMVVGAPFVKGASVSAEVVEQGRGQKIIVFKKKRRQGYRRKKGHQQDLTTLKILSINPDGSKPAPKKAAKPKAEPKPVEVKEETSAEPEGIEPKLLDAPRGEADDLSKISGVGPKLVEKLNGMGVYHFDQIAAWTPENVDWLDPHLKFKGRVEREDWIGQAKALAAGETKED